MTVILFKNSWRIRENDEFTSPPRTDLLDLLPRGGRSQERTTKHLPPLMTMMK